MMGRLLAIWAATWLAGVAAAETVPLRTGEHPGFTRLVVELRRPVPHDVRPVAGGVVLQMEAEHLRIDLARAFDRIGRTRVRNLRQDADGNLVVDLACDCPARAFDLPRHAIVLDIADRAEGPGWVRPLPATAAQPGRTPPELGTATFLQADLPAPGPHDAPPTLTPRQDPGIPTAPAARPASPATPVPAPPAAHDPDNSAPPRSASAHRAALPPVLPAKPIGQLLPELALPRAENPRSPGVDAARRALIGEMQRAIAQGLIEVPRQTLPRLPTQSASADPEKQAPPPPPPPAEPAASGLDHVAVDTAMDRDALGLTLAEGQNAEGRPCLAPELFDLPAWGGDGAAGLDDLRAALVLEFDRPDPAAALRLARRYAFLGFGAEARLVLSVFNLRDMDARVVEEMAHIVDGDAGPKPILASQNGCGSAAALWAILADPALAASPDADLKAVQRAFSALPPHLRNHLGPPLAEAFVTAGDTDTALSLRMMMDRSDVADPVALGQVDARLALANRSAEAASEILEGIVAQDGPDAARALAELIESRIDADLPVTLEQAALADALAVEHRATDLGRRLTRAALRAHARAGDPAEVFERIAAAYEAGSITEEEAARLRAEALTLAARRADDVTFLRIAFGQDVPDGTGATFVAARLALAGRLADLGLARRAEQILAPVAEPSDEVALLRTRLALDLGRPDDALRWARDTDAPQAQALRARALERLGRPEEAARLWQALGEPERAARLAWSSGDFDAVVEGPDPALADGARLALAPPPDGAIALDQDAAPLQRARQLLDGSRAARATLERLLQER